MKVINFSAGLSSAYMTILTWAPGDIVIFCDTGREHYKTYKFLNDFEANEGIPVVRLSYPGGWESFLSEKMNGGLPNRVMRACTKELKIKMARKYLLSVGVLECDYLIGFRKDEKRRVDRYESRYVKYRPKFPLYEMGIDNQMVKDYWGKKSYRLEIPHILGNCDLCFMKGKNAIISILVSFPELAERWIADEDRTGRTYLKGVSIRECLSVANNNLFKGFPLEDISPAYDCACTS